MHAQAAPVRGAALTRNARLLKWVDEIAALAQPDRIYWCDGTDAEYDRLCQALVEAGTFRKLDEKLRPDRKSTRLNSSHIQKSRMPSSA